MDAQAQAELRSQALPVKPDDVLLFDGEAATYQQRYYYQGLRRQPVLKFESESFSIHVLNGEFKAVLSDGDDAMLKIERMNEQGQICLSKT